MCLITKFLEELHEYLTGDKQRQGNIIRKHSKMLDQLGDVSFPLSMKNWSQIIDKTKFIEKGECTIFDYLSPAQDLDSQLEGLLNKSKSWSLVINRCTVRSESDVHLYLNRFCAVGACIKDVLKAKSTYGLNNKCLKEKITVKCENTINCDLSTMNLTELRAVVTQNVLTNVIDSLTDDNAKCVTDISISLNSNKKERNILICGSVLNEHGIKDTKTRAFELFQKRALDLQLMAQHKYGVQVRPASLWKNYFENLGRASVTIEMLQNKLHKGTKIVLNSIQSSSKGPAFVFYNCARLSALFKEFDNRVINKVYPDLPPVDVIDFALLNQPEEWELVYVYVLQFPTVVRSCVWDIQSGIVHLHNLVTFLSSLSSLFSVYYRRVKILTIGKDHLVPTLHARIYLLKAVQQVFHTALYLLNIDPIKEM